jgi:hypothetical protein
MFNEKQDAPETPATQPAAASPDLSGLAQSAQPAAETPKKVAFPSALNPEAAAFINMSISAAVKEIFKEMAPILQSIALTPEKIAEAETLRRAADPKTVAREKREKHLQHLEMEENRQQLLRTRAACAHRYPSGQTAINPVRNFPDRAARGICVLCQEFFEPRRWVIDPPDRDNPRGVPRIADAHPQYKLVLEALAAKG